MLQEMNTLISLHRRAFACSHDDRNECSVYKDADQSARMYVCFACGLKLSKQDAFSSRAVFPFETKIWKKNNIQIDGGLIAYCLIFANPNIEQNTGKFMYFLKQT